jgi:hypothetical protein
MIGKLICWWTGKHRRGVRLKMVNSTSTIPLDHFECPRCKAMWSRKKRTRKAKAQ